LVIRFKGVLEDDERRATGGAVVVAEEEEAEEVETMSPSLSRILRSQNRPQLPRQLSP
jgi:hypothetical protein